MVEYYGSAQEFVTEGSSAPVTADVTGSGSGPDMIAVAPVLSPPDLISMLVFALPLLALYEIGAAISRWTSPSGRRA